MTQVHSLQAAADPTGAPPSQVAAAGSRPASPRVAPPPPCPWPCSAALPRPAPQTRPAPCPPAGVTCSKGPVNQGQPVNQECKPAVFQVQAAAAHHCIATCPRCCLQLPQRSASTHAFQLLLGLLPRGGDVLAPLDLALRAHGLWARHLRGGSRVLRPGTEAEQAPTPCMMPSAARLARPQRGTAASSRTAL